MLKNEILKLTEIHNLLQNSNLVLETEEDINNFIEKLPTIQKIFIVQNLLKELISIKDLFLDNKKNMLKKIDNNCYKYFKNLISIKQIYDYCELHQPEKIIEYKLLKEADAEERLHSFEENQKNFINNFFFILRNNNTLMLKIIKETDTKYYDQLGYFLTHFLYENTTSSNFSQDELILMIYLVMEDTINNKFPENFSYEFLIELTKNKKNYFLYHLIMNLTKKAEIRNYLINLLHDIILDFEILNHILTVNTSSMLDEILDLNDEEIVRRKTVLFSKGGGLKKKVKNQMRYSLNDNHINKLRALTMIDSEIKFDLDEDNENQDILNDLKKTKSEQIENNNNNNKDNKNINTFFEEINLKGEEISKKLKDLNNKEDKTDTEKAYGEFLGILDEQLQKENNNEIYSAQMILETFLESKNEKKKSLSEKDKSLDNIYINNYLVITGFIEDLLAKIINSLNSLPYTIKCIFFFMDELISKKYELNKNITYFQLIILKIKFFFDCFIMPILNNPLYNGCVSDGVVSNNTFDNLKLIGSILERFTLGNLFKLVNDNCDPYFIIFNKFMLEQMQNLFNIDVELEKNIKDKFEPPKFVLQLMESNNRNNIDYDFFIFNENESIQYQSVCFSYSDLIMLINTCKKEDIQKYFEQNTLIKMDFDLLLKYKKKFDEICTKNISENKMEFIFVSDIRYNESFLNEIKAITEEHFENYFKDQKNNSEINEIYIMLKQCLIEIFIYINKINKENFNSFIRNKHELILNNNSHINRYFKKKKFSLYKNSIFEDNNIENTSLDNEKDPLKLNINENRFIKSCLSCDISEDADFLEEIFPRIIFIIKNELGQNFDYYKYERIIFCITFLQLNIKNIPTMYTCKNSGLLFTDIIKDILNLIKGLKNNIILNKFYLKIREGEKMNLILSKYSSEIKSMEKYYIINYLYHKLSLPIPNSSKIKYEKSICISHNPLSLQKTFSKNNNQLQPQAKPITYFVKNFYNFQKMSEIVDDVLSIENDDKIPEIFREYFKGINELLTNEKIMTKFTKDEFQLICYDLENYIMLKLHEKLFPIHPTKGDEFINKKCERLNFIKAENIKGGKKKVNENLLLIVVEYINQIDKKYSPNDKINIFGKAYRILQDSISFSTGKSDLGVDDVQPWLNYVMIKAKPKMINTNYIFCKSYINPDLEKKREGFLLEQIGFTINIISNMRYNDLNGVTEEQFGKDDELPPDLNNYKDKNSSFGT